ncbi:MAG: hypothetical protein M0R73_11760 [Dehalococcoidia bacterium]|nr:hypothetical protein [Dehalococcoidia bacterium]
MKVIGKEIGAALASMHGEITRRVKIEAERELRIEPFEGGSFSNVEWADDAVVISLHNGVPTHALPHVLGVALQHVRQRLDRYPGVLRGPREVEGGPMIRSALRELVMGPEAEMRLAPLELDMQWEVEQRHTGLKDLLRDAPADWEQPGAPGNIFAALQYARFTLEHPEALWGPLRQAFRERLPVAAEHGEGVVQVVQQNGWKTPGACLQSLIAAREELGLAQLAIIEDRQRGVHI